MRPVRPAREARESGSRVTQAFQQSTVRVAVRHIRTQGYKKERPKANTLNVCEKRPICVFNINSLSHFSGKNGSWMQPDLRSEHKT